jgi:formamidopyrimidine-DNA glycosylase
MPRGAEAKHPLLAAMGPEPLEPGFDGAYLSRALAGRLTPIKAALLDQRVVAGIGNLWKAEALWEARVSPWRPVAEVDDAELRAVLEAAHTLMRTAVEGSRPARRVYRRAGRPCPRCGGTVRSWPQGDGARTAYWCPECQVGGNAPPS